MSSNQKEIFSKNLKRLVTNSNLSQREIAISINVPKMEHHDISLIINQLTNILKSTQKVMYNGVPMDEITKELVYSSIEQAARIADANNKKSKINKI